jgi:hypothetical protein
VEDSAARLSMARTSSSFFMSITLHSDVTVVKNVNSSNSTEFPIRWEKMVLIPLTSCITFQRPYLLSRGARWCSG